MNSVNILARPFFMKRKHMKDEGKYKGVLISNANIFRK